MNPPAFIETFTGRRFQPLDPDFAEIDVRDIAHSLSQQCRFTGHTICPYSVAEHSVRVRELVKSWDAPLSVQLWALMHDASEAYLVDIPSPLKCTPVFDLYRTAEKRLMNAVCMRFGLSMDEPAMVSRADAVLVATEARDLMPYRYEHWTKLKERPLVEKILPWGHEIAEREFFAAYKELTQ